MASGPDAPLAVSFGAVLTRALLVKVVLLALLVWAASAHPADPRYVAEREGDAHEVAWILGRGFDAHAYQRLAREGYYDRFSRGFPPGYPLLIGLVDGLVGNAQTAAVLVSNLSAVLAIGAFFVLARRYARERGGHLDLAVLLFATMPGVLAFGTVAYSESTFLVPALLSWWAYLQAEQRKGSRSAAWLVLASLLAGLGVMVRHAGASVFLALAVCEVARIVRSGPGQRARAVGEAAATLWAALLVAAYFVWKYAVHDLAGVQQEIWDMRVVPLGGPWSLMAMGTAPEYLAMIYASLPLVLVLALRAGRIDARLAVVAGAALLLALSYTGIAAQSFTRYAWTIWPLALGALAIADRAVLWALCGVLFCVSAWCGFGHVLGTAAF